MPLRREVLSAIKLLLELSRSEILQAILKLNLLLTTRYSRFLTLASWTLKLLTNNNHLEMTDLIKTNHFTRFRMGLKRE